MADNINDAINDLAKSFEAFKATNDERIAELLKSQAGELTAQVERLEAVLAEKEQRIADLEAKAARPAMGADGLDPALLEHRDAFLRYMRKNDKSGLEKRDDPNYVQTGEDSDGGYAVPEILLRTIIDLMTVETPMRQVCSVQSVGDPNIKQLVDLGGATTGWVGETDSRPQTNTPQLTTITPVWGEIYAFPFATQRALDDIFFDVANWLTDHVARKFSKEENIAFTSGNGSNKPKGLLAYDMVTTDDDTRDFGKFQYFKTGVAAKMPATSAAFGDLLIDVITALKARYHGNARWMMTRKTLAEVRKLKDADNNYLWQPGLQSGEPNSILGFPYTYNDDMPQIGANALCVAFGDFRAAYSILDRIGIRILRDEYTNKPFVGFYTTKRVGNMMTNSESVKFIKCEA